jgi:diamine N-acetyltransferase
MTENAAAPAAYPVRFAYAVAKHVYLRYLTEADARGDWHLWFNSPEVTRNLAGQTWVNTPEEQVGYLQKLRTSRDRLTLAVVDRATDVLVGVGGLSKIDNVNRKAEMSLVIGSAEHREGLHALEALTLFTEIGLARFNLNKVIATGLVISEAGLKMTRFLGYKDSGVFREHAFVEGRYVDCVILEILQREWLNSPRRPKSIQWIEHESKE